MYHDDAETGEVETKLFELSLMNLSKMLEEGKVFRSPTFKFRNHTWYLQFHIRVASHSHRSSEVVSLRLVRSSPGHPTWVRYNFGVLTANGKEERKIQAVDMFDSQVLHSWRGTFLTRGELDDRMSELAPNDQLIVTCILKLFDQKSPQADNPSRSEFMKNIYLEGNNCDVTFTARERTFRAHRQVLLFRTPWFGDRLPTERNSLDLDPAALEQFLLYVYTGVLEGPASFDLYRLAKFHGWPALQELCVHSFMESMNPGNVLDAIRFAKWYDLDQVRESAVSCFVSNAETILSTPGWLRFLKRYPQWGNELYIRMAKSLAPCHGHPECPVPHKTGSEGVDPARENPPPTGYFGRALLKKIPFLQDCFLKIVNSEFILVLPSLSS